jgi:transketolase N-terminal domain/subunit
MSEQSPKEESFSLEQLVVSHSYEMIALITVLEKKGILTRQELIEVIKEIQSRGEG